MNILHNFYIPVMGTGFTIDTPLFVAKYGISSVISLTDDVLIEQMRKFWCKKYNEPYEPITSDEEDARAKRITAYLNLLQKLVYKQIEIIKNVPFEPDSDISRYFELLPSDHQLKQLYDNMLQENNAEEKQELQRKLREAITAGKIDVNIMTKLDKENYSNGTTLPYEFSDAASALRGYAKSNLCSTVVFSAGFNPSLYGYIAKFADFFPDENSHIEKKICLKVSDYRSAAIQGKYLAKRGIWVSEYRIESPLNCGGHAFVNDGQLLGPILAEFKQRKNELMETLFSFYKIAVTSIKKFCADIPQKIKITVQGGVGTHNEHEFLMKHYGLDAVGWGTPFLLVPEVTNVDDVTLDKLLNAKAEDVILSSSSPLGVPFWNLRNSPSEEICLARIKNNNPGSNCVKGYLRFSKEFTNRPICMASREYQTFKLQELEKSDLPNEKLQARQEDVLSKSCICCDLGGGVLKKRNIDSKVTPAICPGPNIINFKKIATLKEMIDHIYGRCSLLVNDERPHVFINELQLQVNYLLNEVRNASLGLPARSQRKLAEVKKNFSTGIEYYRTIAKELLEEQRGKFLEVLEELSYEINKICLAKAPN
ncbi:MAG: hypothetical protein LBL17_00070 [Coxiellaceae bacterium]|nr:hypothetical protein [Coxiellaceae bacterium]